MSASVRVYKKEGFPNKTSIWLPNSATFLVTFRQVNARLRPIDSELKQEITMALNDPISFLDMTTWDSSLLSRLFMYIKQVIDDLMSSALNQHGISFEQYDDSKYVNRICDLKVLIHLDERDTNSKYLNDLCKIIMSDQISYNVPKWVFELVIFDLIKATFSFGVKIEKESRNLHFDLIQKMYATRQQNKWDLRSLTKEHHKILFSALDLMIRLYGFKTKGLEYSQVYRDTMCNSVDTFAELYHQAYPDILRWWQELQSSD
jgi:hypothetical protein